MSYKYGSAMVPGAYHYGGGGLGVLGSAVPSTGEHGASYLYNDLTLPADNNVEVRGLIVTPPAAGTWFAWEDGSFSLTGAADGAYTFVYRLYADGVDMGLVTSTITIGSESLSALSGSAQIADLTVDGGFGGVLVLGSLVGSRRKTMPTRTNKQTATR